MRRRELPGASLALTARAPLRGWSAVLDGAPEMATKSLGGAGFLLRGSPPRPSRTRRTCSA